MPPTTEEQLLFRKIAEYFTDPENPKYPEDKSTIEQVRHTVVGSMLTGAGVGGFLGFAVGSKVLRARHRALGTIGGFILGLSVGGRFAPLGSACEQIVVLPTPMGKFAREKAQELLPPDHPMHQLYQGQEFVREKTAYEETPSFSGNRGMVGDANRARTREPTLYDRMNPPLEQRDPSLRREDDGELLGDFTRPNHRSFDSTHRHYQSSGLDDSLRKETYGDDGPQTRRPNRYPVSSFDTYQPSGAMSGPSDPYAPPQPTPSSNVGMYEQVDEDRRIREQEEAAARRSDDLLSRAEANRRARLQQQRPYAPRDEWQTERRYA